MSCFGEDALPIEILAWAPLRSALSSADRSPRSSPGAVCGCSPGCRHWAATPPARPPVSSPMRLDGREHRRPIRYLWGCRYSWRSVSITLSVIYRISSVAFSSPRSITEMPFPIASAQATCSTVPSHTASSNGASVPSMTLDSLVPAFLRDTAKAASGRSAPGEISDGCRAWKQRCDCAAGPLLPERCWQSRSR